MRILVTGGAGFIGSNVAMTLAKEGHEVRVLDNLSTGYKANVPIGVELMVGDVADELTVRAAMEGVELVFHHAAARAVLLSVERPIETDRANTGGTLNVLKAALDAGTRRVVYASSSSVYGGTAEMPTAETARPRPRSPYAVSKLAGEEYCRVFSELYGLETVALRYFNVYGPRQRPDSAYAAVIPLFLDAITRGQPATVHGDGLQSRDFTFVSDVVSANMCAAAAPSERCSGKVYNIAGGRARSLMELLSTLGSILDVEPRAHHVDARPGDVRHSQANAAAAARDLGFKTRVDFVEGLERTVTWFASRSEAANAT